MVVGGGQLEVALESPLDNLLGFERAPRTDKQRAAVPAHLKGMDVALMAAFPGLRKLGVQVAGPKGHSAPVLTPGKLAVNW